MDSPKASNKEILLFSMPEEVGALAKALKIFEVSYPFFVTKRKSALPPLILLVVYKSSFEPFFIRTTR